MIKIRLLVIWAGGHGRSVAEAAQLSGLFNVAGFLDDAPPSGGPLPGAGVLGPVASIATHYAQFDEVAVAIGANTVREKLMQHLVRSGIALASVIHPRATVSPSAVLGAGSAIMAGAVIGTEARLGTGTIVNCGAVVDHHAVVEDYGHLGVNACMAGGTVLGKGSWMQAGSALGYGVTIPAGTTLRPGEALDSTNNKHKP